MMETLTCRVRKIGFPHFRAAVGDFALDDFLEFLETSSSKQSLKPGVRLTDARASAHPFNQAMLEATTRYAKRSLVALASRAFVRYRDKRHVSFRVQADRLRSFAWRARRLLARSRESA